jgi:hypothetical protein
LLVNLFVIHENLLLALSPSLFGIALEDLVAKRLSGDRFPGRGPIGWFVG